MLNTYQLRSKYRPFVSTSITESPWLNNLKVFYHITLTDKYRKCASVLTYTSVFALTTPETFDGFKTYEHFEDEVRLLNGTQIEKGTLEITFRYGALPPKSIVNELVEKYAPLGSVHIECAS